MSTPSSIGSPTTLDDMASTKWLSNSSVDRFVDDHSLGVDAGLSIVQEAGGHGDLRGSSQVSGGHHDEWVAAAQLVRMDF